MCINAFFQGLWGKICIFLMVKGSVKVPCQLRCVEIEWNGPYPDPPVSHNPLKIYKLLWQLSAFISFIEYERQPQIFYRAGVFVWESITGVGHWGFKIH